jgi:hypothetical protein
MRRPEISSGRRNRVRLRRKKNPGTARPQRRKPPREPLAKPAPPPANAPQASIAGGAAASPSEEIVAREALRYGFGAVRVGALLGRLRLHLQTERFLAVHRGDALWEEGCLGAAFALADVVAGLAEDEFNSPLPRDPQEPSVAGRQTNASGLPPAESTGRPLETPLETRDKHGKPELQEFHPEFHEGLGSRKIGTITLARCSAQLERGGR